MASEQQRAKGAAKTVTRYPVAKELREEIVYGLLAGKGLLYYCALSVLRDVYVREGWDLCTLAMLIRKL